MGRQYRGGISNLSKTTCSDTPGRGLIGEFPVWTESFVVGALAWCVLGLPLLDLGSQFHLLFGSLVPAHSPVDLTQEIVR